MGQTPDTKTDVTWAKPWIYTGAAIVALIVTIDIVIAILR